MRVLNRRNESNQTISGYGDVFVYVLFSAVSFVFLDELCHEVAPLVALFVMSGIAILGFNVLGFRSIKKIYRAVWQHKALFFTMSFALGLDWLLTVYATYLADPFVSMASVFIALAMLGFIQLYRLTREVRYLVSVLFLVLGLFALYFGYTVRHSECLLCGIVLGLVAGGGFFIYMMTSEQFTQKANLSSIEVLATRFWVLFIGTGCLISWNELKDAVLQYGGALTLVSLGSLIVPIFFNQQAIKKLGAMWAAVFISLDPAVTYLVYALWTQTISVGNSVVCLSITVALVVPQATRLYQRRSIPASFGNS